MIKRNSLELGINDEMIIVGTFVLKNYAFIDLSGIFDGYEI